MANKTEALAAIRQGAHIETSVNDARFGPEQRTYGIKSPDGAALGTVGWRTVKELCVEGHLRPQAPAPGANPKVDKIYVRCGAVPA